MKDDIKNYKYEIYCGKCDVTLGFSKNIAKPGDDVTAVDTIHPNGDIVKIGDEVRHGSSVFTHGIIYKQRKNIHYEEKN